MYDSLKNLMDEGLNVNALRTNAVLKTREWIAYDEAVINVARPNLVALSDLQSFGLVRNLNSLGVVVDEWESISDMSDANVDMAAETDGTEDTQTFTVQGIPIPMIHKPFRINVRRLEASRRNGSNIDTTQAEVAGRKVADAIENMIFNGASVKADSRTLPGYTNFTYRNQVTSCGMDWDGTPANIVPDCEKLLAAADLVYRRGPFVLYVPYNFWSALRGDQVSTTGYPFGKTYLDRVLQFKEIVKVQPTPWLSDNNVVMVQMDRQTVDMSIAQNITNVQWEEKGNMVVHMRVLAAMAPRLKFDDNGKSGVFHGT